MSLEDIFDFQSESIRKITFNLKRRLEDLKKAEKNIPSSAYLDMRSEDEDSFDEILINSAEDALASSKEFNHPIFESKLIDGLAYSEDEDHYFLYPQGDNRTLTVEGNLDSTLGTLEDYAQGVKVARVLFDSMRKGKYKPDVASRYWRDRIYGARAKAGEEPSGGDTGEDRYSLTIKLRLQDLEQEAPFWRLLNDGVPQVLTSSRGGTAFPTSSPTRFLETALAQIRRVAEADWEDFIETAYQEILPQIIEIEETLENIFDVVNMIRESPEDYQEPEILQKLEVDGKIVYQYVTGTLKIGIAQIPRWRGKRISVVGF